MIYITLKSKVKYPHYRHEGPRGAWMKGSTYTQPRRYEDVGWLVIHSAALAPGTHFIGGQYQSVHEGVKKNLHPSDTRDQTRAV